MKRRSGLGRGLDALLPDDDRGGFEARSGLMDIPLDLLDPNPRQPRDSFDHEELKELAASIAALGVLQPVLVRPKGQDRYELIAGERRVRAAQLAGLRRIAAIVSETDDRGSLERALVENVHRSDLNPIEEAAALKGLLEDAGLTQEALGQRVGKSRVAITNALRLLDLSTAVQRQLIHGGLTAGHGRALLGLEQSSFQQRLAVRIAQEGLSVRETEDLVRRYRAMSGSPSKEARGGAGGRPPLATEAQRRLADHLQTRVRVEVGKRKGKIVLDFSSLEELERLLTALLGEHPAERATITPR